MAITRTRLPLLVDQKVGTKGIHERIEIDFEQVLRDGTEMSKVGKLRLARGDSPISVEEAKAHIEAVQRWGILGSSVNSFVGGEVAENELGDSLRRFACYADVVEDNRGRRVDWETAMPATRWIEADGTNCFEANKALFLQLKNDGVGKIVDYRNAAKKRSEAELQLLFEDTYAPLLTDSLFRGGPVELALWTCIPQNIDSEEVVAYKEKARASEVGVFFMKIMEMVNERFALERQFVEQLVEEDSPLLNKPEASPADVDKLAAISMPETSVFEVFEEPSTLSDFSTDIGRSVSKKIAGSKQMGIRPRRAVRIPPKALTHGGRL